ncbi:MAG: hypothetical protein ACK4RF_01755 [Cyclobacteriaceae bacterium]
MNQAIDSLFRSKLEHHATPAPQQAWGRIEAGLRKPSDQKFWLKAAAVITLLAAVSVFLFYSITSHEQPVARQLTETDTHQTKSAVQSAQTNEVLLPVLPEAPKTPRAKKQINEPKVVATAEVQLPVQDVIESVAPIQTQEEPISQPATGLLIVYSVEEVNSKYLLKTPVAQATVDLKKSSRLQTLAGLAHNFGNDDLLGNLRDRKNELFALNFLEDKKEKKN